MSDANRDQNHVPVALGQSSASATVTLPFKISSSTGRLLVDLAGGSGTVTSVSVVTANGFAGTVANATTTPAITISTTINAPVLAGNGTAISAATTTGSTSTVVLQTSPTLITPVLGVATATSINKLTITPPASSATLTIADGKTLTVNNILTFTGTDSSSVAFGTGGTVLYTTSTIPLTVGTTTIASGTTTRILYDNAGSGTVVAMATAAVLTSATITTKLSPTSDDGAPLGDTTHNFSDLFLASGAVINIANGNWVATHTSAILTVGTGDLRVTTAGTNTASVVTVGGTQTLTAKTLTAPIIGGAASLADGATISKILPTVDGTATGPVTSAFVSGYTSSAIGDLVYLDSSGKWQKTDADSTTTAYGLLGIALAVAATDAALLVALPGAIVYATAFPTLTIGATYYISETAGAISASIPTGADNVIRVVGFGVHADKLFFLPSSDVQTTVA